MQDASPLELSGLAALGALGSVCAVLLRSTHKNLESLEQMRREATNLVEQLRGELRDNDETISKLQALCADYRLSTDVIFFDPSGHDLLRSGARAS